MTESVGRRERQKMEMRRRLAEVAARLFAEQGYDAVSMADVAKAAEVAEQTVYNYFPTKPDLVLDRAADVLEQSRRTVAERDPALTPAEALSAQIHADIDHFAARDPFFARGEFPAQSVASDALRRYALQFRHRQADAIAEAISETDPIIPAPVARAHAHALMTVIQTTTDRVGSAFLSGVDPATITPDLHADAEITLADAAENFRATQERAAKAVQKSEDHQTPTGA